MDELLAKLAVSIQDPVSVLLMIAVVYLWRRLEECTKNHLDCERKNLLLAASIEDLAEGRMEDAKEKAQKIVDSAKSEVQGK